MILLARLCLRWCFIFVFLSVSVFLWATVGQEFREWGLDFSYRVPFSFITQWFHHLTGHCKVVIVLNYSFSSTFINRIFMQRSVFFLLSPGLLGSLKHSPFSITRNAFLSIVSFQGKERYPLWYLWYPQGDQRGLGMRIRMGYLSVTLWAWGTGSSGFHSIVVVHFVA